MNNDKLSSRIQSSLKTVQAWDADPSLLRQCRDQIPLDIIYPEQYYLYSNNNNNNNSNNSNTTNSLISPYANPKDDDQYQGDDLLLKRLTLYFQKTMQWVNNPPCTLCSNPNTQLLETRGPQTSDEIQGQAHRVEVYYCPTCDDSTSTTFPRYNSVQKLLQTKRGRCGEYANLFGLYCRSLGFETRYVCDLTDHVWVEVWSVRSSRWIMADGCEGKIDATSMYEKGWGKKLNYILAITVDSVVDVTKRYTRKWNCEEFQQRRRDICPGGNLQSDLLIAQLNQSFMLKANLPQSKLEENQKRNQLEQDFFKITETLQSWDTNDYSEGRVSGSLTWRLARGEAKMENIGNKSSSSSSSYTATTISNTNTTMNTKNSSVHNSPHESSTIHNASSATTVVEEPMEICVEQGTIPKEISTRLPEQIMPIQTQLLASEEQKHAAFLHFIQVQQQQQQQNEKSGIIVGYCTKKGAPIYLFTNAGRPLQKCGSHSLSSSQSNTLPLWNCYLYLPSSSIPSNKKFHKSSPLQTPKYDIPVAESFFQSILGTNLIQNNNQGDVTNIPTIQALNKSRLVGLYFSAHWCGPCRSFTPMLCEMYNVLKEEEGLYASHGLEIVFVSSDRDEMSFRSYFRSMPWLALPYTQGNILQKNISARFGVRGIPTLIILDVISGEIVVTRDQTRADVLNACKRGETAIQNLMKNDWLMRIPEESRLILETLELSCNDIEETQPSLDVEPKPVCNVENETVEERIKKLFTELVSNGMSPNEAAVKAINQIAEDEKVKKNSFDTSLSEPVEEVSLTYEDINHDVVKVAKRYLDNVLKEPWNPKYRHFKLSNKIFDRIVSSENGIRDVCYLGFEVFDSEADFIACIPLAANLDAMKERIDFILGS